MSNLTQARKKLHSVPSLLRQNKVLAALHAFYDGLRLYLKQPLMKQEKKELAKIITDNVYYLNQNPKLREQYPILIEYKEGEEKAFLKTLKELLEVFQEEIHQTAREQLAELEKQKQDKLNQAKAELEERKIEQAEKIYAELIQKFKDDSKLKIAISDQLIANEYFEQAIKYLKEAYKQDPNSVDVFNRLGMSLRKLGRYEDAIKAYQHALKLDPQDEYLYFNLARVYLDQKDYAKAKEVVSKALKINPDFELAQKMLKFLEKQGEK